MKADLKFSVLSITILIINFGLIRCTTCPKAFSMKKLAKRHYSSEAFPLKKSNIDQDLEDTNTVNGVLISQGAQSHFTQQVWKAIRDQRNSFSYVNDNSSITEDRQLLKEKLVDLKNSSIGKGYVKFEGDTFYTYLNEGIGLIDEAITAIDKKGEIGTSQSRSWLNDECAEKVLKCVQDNQETRSIPCIKSDDEDTIEYRLNKYGKHPGDPLADHKLIDGEKIFHDEGEYATNAAYKALMQLYLDDGDKSRRNRNILNNEKYVTVGTAYSFDLKKEDGGLIQVIQFSDSLTL